MKIALLSDSHNDWDELTAAVTAANAADCEVLFFAGDLVAPDGVELLAEFAGPVHMIIGNNEFQIEEIWAAAEATENVIYHGDVCDIDRQGLRVFMHHYPHVAREAAATGTYDLCIHGHTHRRRDERSGDTRLVNPGAITRQGSQPEWAILDTNSGKLEPQSISR